MAASFFNLLRSGPPPPKAVLLPGALFFTRSIPITAGATNAEVAAEIELALEAMAPFPLGQLYYGWYAQPGGGRAFVFAAYRRRFTADQAATWGDAELVLPAFASVFGARVEPATTIVITEPDGLTAVHWEDSAVPARVLVHPLAADADGEERARVRGDLLAAIGDSKTVIDLAELPVPESARSDREMLFRSGEFESRLPAGLLTSFDVRDKGELASLRGARRRDLILWRTVLGSVAALILFGVGEIGLFGGRAWQGVRVAKLNAQKPIVEKIMSSQALATRIEDLATKQMMPLEMVTELAGVNLERIRPDIQFTRIQSDKTRGIYSVVIDAQTPNAAQMNVYEAVLKKLPSIETVEFIPQPSRNEYAIFRIIATFKPGALKPTT